MRGGIWGGDAELGCAWAAGASIALRWRCAEGGPVDRRVNILRI